MPVLLKNNVSSTLLSDISASDVELTVASGEGANFPTVGLNEFFFITVTNPGGAQEIMKVISRTSDTMAIVRAQDGTSARAFTANALVQMLVNAASVSQFVAEFDRSAEDVSYDNTASGLTATNAKAAIDELNTLRTAANTSYSNATSGLTATDVQAAVDELRSSDNITYDGTVSGLAATDVKAAIDELDGLRTGGDVSYNNTVSGLTATTVQAAIDELDTLRTAGDTTYDNTASGLVATDVKAAIDELAADTVATADLDDDAVTYAKMQNVVTANRLLGSTSADGIVSEVQVQTDMIADDAVTLAKMADGNSGDILYYAGTGAPTRLAKGTDGQVLELQAGFPSWQTPASAGTSGSGANDRVAVWSGSTSLDSSSLFTYNSSTLTLTLDNATLVGRPGGGPSGNSIFTVDQISVGSIVKGSGTFNVPHPLKPDTHRLVHSFIEGPQADNIYRGKIDLVDGSASVNIDTQAGMTEGTFVVLNRDVQCFVSNESGWTAVKGSVSGNILTITAQDSACTDTVSWLVIGERQDQHMYESPLADADGKIIVEPPVESQLEGM